MAAATAEALDAAAAAEAAVTEALCALETRDDETLDEEAPPEAMTELDVFRPAKGTLLALMGLPAAGKSTLATALKAVDTHDVRVVRFDDDLEASGALDQWAPGKWHEARSKSLRRVQGFVQNLPPSDSPYIVVADDNNPLKSMRHALFKIARDHGWAYATVRLECSQQIAEARNAARSGAAKVPQDTTEQMATDLEPPDAGRQGWERFAVTVRTAREGAFTLTRRATSTPSPRRCGATRCRRSSPRRTARGARARPSCRRTPRCSRRARRRRGTGPSPPRSTRWIWRCGRASATLRRPAPTTWRRRRTGGCWARPSPTPGRMF